MLFAQCHCSSPPSPHLPLQGAGLLNDLVVSHTPTTWSITSKAAMISIVETYPKSGAQRRQCGGPESRQYNSKRDAPCSPDVSGDGDGPLARAPVASAGAPVQQNRRDLRAGGATGTVTPMTDDNGAFQLRSVLERDSFAAAPQAQDSRRICSVCSCAGVELTLEWTGELPGKQTEFFIVSEDDKTLLRSVELTLSTGMQWRGNSIYRRA